MQKTKLEISPYSEETTNFSQLSPLHLTKKKVLDFRGIFNLRSTKIIDNINNTSGNYSPGKLLTFPNTNQKQNFIGNSKLNTISNIL